MSGVQSFEPDDLYCVYCHARAAGACGGCGAICCADCVELRLGVSRSAAICQHCLDNGWTSPWTRWTPRLAVVGAALIAGLMWFFF